MLIFYKNGVIMISLNDSLKKELHSIDLDEVATTSPSTPSFTEVEMPECFLLMT